MKNVDEIETWGQFHQQFTSSFYSSRSRKHKNGCQFISLCCAFGIFVRKSCLQNVGEIDPWRRLHLLDHKSLKAQAKVYFDRSIRRHFFKRKLFVPTGSSNNKNIFYMDINKNKIIIRWNFTFEWSINGWVEKKYILIFQITTYINCFVMWTKLITFFLVNLITSYKFATFILAGFSINKITF